MDSVLFKNRSFIKINNEFEESLIKFYFQSYTHIIEEGFKLYVNAGFDLNDLLSFSFEKMPHCFSKDEVKKN